MNCKMAISEEVEIVKQLDAEIRAFKNAPESRRSSSPPILKKNSFVFQPLDEYPSPSTTLGDPFDDPDVWRPPSRDTLNRRSTKAPTRRSSQDAKWACGAVSPGAAGCGAKSSASKGSSSVRSSTASTVVGKTGKANSNKADSQNGDTDDGRPTKGQYEGPDADLAAMLERDVLETSPGVSFAGLRKPQQELDGKACAAVGQSGLMALYDALFSQLDVASSQLVVTDRDFKDPGFSHQLIDTVNSLLHLRVPIFNENDAISTRKAPYEDSSGIFWDNDSLAALLALELNADLLVLLSDVEGLYSGPPGEPHSKIIHTYIKEIHSKEITFGDKSRVGRGGMNTKVKAAVHSCDRGTPVVVTSGFATDNIIKVLRGERIGTVFHRDSHLWLLPTEASAREMAVSARECSRRLQRFSSEERRKILLDIADTLEANVELIKTENEADVIAAQKARYERALISQLTLKPEKISSLTKSIRVLAEMEDPIAQVTQRTELADGLILEKTSCPLGVLLIVFESRPDAFVQIASLAVRSGNGLFLKGGKEAMRSNAILHKIITGAIPDSVGQQLIGLVTSREEIPDLLKLDDVIDLVIPRGSNKLVSQIKESTKIPVLGHSDGICHVYVDKAADMNMAKHIVLDAKTDYPAACNAMETVIVHRDLMESGEINVQRSQGFSLWKTEDKNLFIDGVHSKHVHHIPSLSASVQLVSMSTVPFQKKKLDLAIYIFDDCEELEELHQDQGRSHDEDCRATTTRDSFILDPNSRSSSFEERGKNTHDWLIDAHRPIDLVYQPVTHRHQPMPNVCYRSKPLKRNDPKLFDPGGAYLGGFISLGISLNHGVISIDHGHVLFDPGGTSSGELKISSSCQRKIGKRRMWDHTFPQAEFAKDGLNSRRVLFEERWTDAGAESNEASFSYSTRTLSF